MVYCKVASNTTESIWLLTAHGARRQMRPARKQRMHKKINLYAALLCDLFFSALKYTFLWVDGAIKFGA